MEVVRIRPRGYCHGVVEAIRLAKRVGAESDGKPVTMLGYLVHNEHATRELEEAGVRLVAESDRMKGLAQITEEMCIRDRLWGVTNFFGSLEFCLSRIFDFPQRGFLRQRAMGAVMMFVLVAGLLIAVAANTLMNLIPVMAGIGPVAGLLAMGALTLTIYRLVPNRTFRIRQLWPGALVSGVLIELITLLFPLYAKLAHGFDTYGQSLALFFLLATWLFFLSEFIPVSYTHLDVYKRQG